MMNAFEEVVLAMASLYYANSDEVESAQLSLAAELLAEGEG